MNNICVISLQEDVKVEFELGGNYETMVETDGMTTQILCSQNKMKIFDLMVMVSNHTI